MLVLVGPMKQQCGLAQSTPATDRQEARRAMAEGEIEFIQFSFTVDQHRRHHKHSLQKKSSGKLA
jgi:hypothetical protein